MPTNATIDEILATTKTIDDLYILIHKQNLILEDIKTFLSILIYISILIFAFFICKAIIYLFYDFLNKCIGYNGADNSLNGYDTPHYIDILKRK